MKASLFRGFILFVAVCLMAAVPAQAATITWDGAGSGVGTGGAWDGSANWSTPGSFNATSTILDFGSITSNTVLSASPASTPETISFSSLYFGDATSTASSPNITLNGDGTSGDVTLALPTTGTNYIYLGPPGSTVGTGPIYTLGSDLILSLGNGFTSNDNIGAYVTNSNVSGTLNGKSVLLINALITGSSASSTSGTVTFSPTSAYATGHTSNAVTILTNNSNSFDAPITVVSGYLGYTSIANAGVNSALGTSGIIDLNNSGAFVYVGSTSQSSTSTINMTSSGATIENAASAPSTLTLGGTFNSTASAANTVRLAATTGNTLKVASTIANGTGGGAVAVAKDATAAVTSYYDASGIYHTSTNGGTVILSGSNTYTGGTTVSAGMLLVANSSGSGTGTGSVTVNSGATFGGTGFVAASGTSGITVANGGFLAPGATSAGSAVGTLTLNAASKTSGALLTMSTGSQFEFTLGSGNASSLIAFTNFTASDLSLSSNSFVFSGAQAGQFVLFEFYSDNGTTLTADGLTAANFNLAGSTGLSGYTDSLDFSTNGEVILDVQAIPEPNSIGLLLGGLGFLLFFVRLRRAAV